MKKYEYVRIRGNKFIGAIFEEHRKVIDDYALKGFSYVGFIPVEISDYGKIKEIDLIFEKEK
ncbi:MAG: DUF4177 domain-containing protein [Firmicutes bacterium]|nr:DUF4177 domain-containing protein [Bacillota bacterium]